MGKDKTQNNTFCTKRASKEKIFSTRSATGEKLMKY